MHIPYTEEITWHMCAQIHSPSKTPSTDNTAHPPVIAHTVVTESMCISYFVASACSLNIKTDNLQIKPAFPVCAGVQTVVPCT